MRQPLTQNEPLARGVRFRNGNGFSTGHRNCLPKNYYMIDIDKMRVSADFVISRENSVFMEYDISRHYGYKAGVPQLGAMFSMKHRNATLTPQGHRATHDFVEEINNQVLREMARRCGSRLVLVLHGDDENPPFNLHEIDVETGKQILTAHVEVQKEEAWRKAWQLLGLTRY